jgi:hypothetical protein
LAPGSRHDAGGAFEVPGRTVEKHHEANRVVADELRVETDVAWILENVVDNIFEGMLKKMHEEPLSIVEG